MKWNNAMTQEQRDAFQEKGTWYLARGLRFFKRDEDGEIIDNPNDTYDWRIETLTKEDVERDFDCAGNLFAYADDDDDEIHPLDFDKCYGYDSDDVKVVVCDLFDNKEEADEFLKEEYLAWLERMRPEVSMNSLMKLDKRIKAIKEGTEKYSDFWKLHC